MPLSAFSENYAVYDVTPVENLFLLEYMPQAPGDYVRVYLYGLMQCRHPDGASLEDVARILRMKREDVLDALRYWEQKGLVVGVSDNPPAFQYVNVRSAMLSEGGGQEAREAYQYRDFNAELQRIAGQILRPQQYQMAMEWVEDLRLPPDVVLLMAQGKADQLQRAGGGKRRSAAYLFKVLEETARDWAARGVVTAEAARQELSKGTAAYQCAQQVVRKFGLKRGPTQMEVDMADKWLGEWGFSDQDIEAALKETTASANPSFAYLDGILKNHRGGGEAGLQQRLGEDKRRREAVKCVNQALGAQSTAPTPEMLAAYEAWLLQGFEPGAIERAAALCGRKGRSRFEDLQALLEKWQAQGLTTLKALDVYLSERDGLKQAAQQVLDAAGVDRRAADADIQQMRDWLNAQPLEVVRFAAESARGKKMPLRWMDAALRAWTQQGVRDVEGARQQRDAGKNRARAQETKPAPAQQYHQRAYDDQFFDGFFVDLSQGGEQK